MIYTLLVSDEATFDIAEASFWYNSKKSGLAERFQEDVKDGISYIVKEPLTIQKRFKHIRVYYTKTFPFGIHYIVNNNVVKVLAVFHTSKHPKSWRERLFKKET